MVVKRTTVTVLLGDWAGGSTIPYIPFKTVNLDLSSYNHVYAITPVNREGGYIDRWKAMVVGTTNDKSKVYVIGCYTDSTYVNQFSGASVDLAILYD